MSSRNLRHNIKGFAVSGDTASRYCMPAILYPRRKLVRYQFKTVNMIMIINSRRHTENGDFDIIKFFSLRRVQIAMLRCRGKSQDNVPLSGIIVNKWNVFRIFLTSVILNCYLNRQHLHYVGETCKRSFTSMVVSIVYSVIRTKNAFEPEEFESLALRLRVDGTFWKRWRHNSHVDFLTKFSSNEVQNERWLSRF